MDDLLPTSHPFDKLLDGGVTDRVMMNEGLSLLSQIEAKPPRFG